MNLSEQQVDLIAQRLAHQLLGEGPTVATSEVTASPTPAKGDAPAATTAASKTLGEGVHSSVDEAVAAAATAFRHLGAISLAQRSEIVAAIRRAMLEIAEPLAKAAWQETGLGRWRHKLVKNRLVTLKTPGPEVLEPRTWTGDRGLTLTEWAPYGVIGAITPCTNPTATIICNTIGMVSAGNTVVFNVHPAARRCSMETVRAINRAITGAGGPPAVVNTVIEPTIASAQELMKHRGVRLLVVTGGPGVVEVAMKSGKRAICAGPGNPPVVVDATADPATAARDIVTGASFDNNVICTDEKEVFVVEKSADSLLREFANAGAYVADAAARRRLEEVIFNEVRGAGRPAVVAKDMIGKDAAEILERAGIQSDDTPLIVMEVPAEHPLIWTEQLMPVLPVARVPDVDAGIDLAVRAERGCGHSAAMHSRDIGALSRMARAVNTSIFVKNGPIAAGLGEGGEGYTSFTIASPTGEGLTGPVSFSRQRRCVLVDHFRIV
jgi:acyl-CoA reductase-like NAD-dependent aldehyde dehydrogenase